QSSGTIGDNNNINPNWTFEKSVDFTKGSIPVQISINDEDDTLRLSDDNADISPGDGDVNDDMTLALGPCGITGDVTKDCGSQIVTEGNGNGDANARIVFKIEVIGAPVSAPGLRVRCLHSPLWPQPGQTVNIVAEALDGTLKSKNVDTLEVWVQN